MTDLPEFERSDKKKEDKVEEEEEGKDEL